jgi:polysaccharide biosynthesis protein VpsM
MKLRLSLFCVASLFLPTTSNAQELILRNLDIVSSNTLIAAATPMMDMPMGQGVSDSSLLPEDNIADDDNLFGTPGGGYVHPFISIQGLYTDNVYNLDDDHTSDFLTTIAPGIWLSLPSRKEVPLALASNNTSAGGLQAALPEYEGFDRINAYLMGGLDYTNYSEESQLSDWTAVVQGLFKYNFRNGLSFEAVDGYTRGQDSFDVGNAFPEEQRQFNSNLFIADVDWLFTEKLRAKVEYSNFILDYDDQIDDFMNRKDNAFAVYGFFNVSLKTTVYLQYEYVDVKYDTADLKDNEQDYIYGGVDWDSGSKTAVSLKAGYQHRTYANSQVNDAVDASNNVSNDAFAVELAFQYKVTDKTGLTIGGFHKLEETDTYNALNKTVLGGTARYEQEITQRIQALCDLRYENADYGQLTGERDDHTWEIRPALQYVFEDWLMAEIAYKYEIRDSSDDFYNYDTNNISFSLTAAL